MRSDGQIPSTKNGNNSHDDTCGVYHVPGAVLSTFMGETKYAMFLLLLFVEQDGGKSERKQQGIPKIPPEKQCPPSVRQIPGRFRQSSRIPSSKDPPRYSSGGILHSSAQYLASHLLFSLISRG